LIGGVGYLFVYTADVGWLIPFLVCLSRVGGAMSFNIGYVSVARLFPTQYVATVFGIVNFFSHSITVGAPMVAEFSDPIPFMVFCINSFLAIFACTRLVEYNDLEKNKVAKEKKIRSKRT
jgi:hypothetical protein